MNFGHIFLLVVQNLTRSSTVQDCISNEHEDTDAEQEFGAVHIVRAKKLFFFPTDINQLLLSFG